MNVTSDAGICHQDLYLMYIKFRLAFNTIDRDKLLRTMYDLGSPTDAIEMKASLYTDATTRINLDFALTDLIELGRGTIPGDMPLPIKFDPASLTLPEVRTELNYYKDNNDYRKPDRRHTTFDASG